jgi:hypothetical protein
MKLSLIDNDDEIISLTNFVKNFEKYVLKSTFNI